MLSLAAQFAFLLPTSAPIFTISHLSHIHTTPSPAWLLHTPPLLPPSELRQQSAFHCCCALHQSLALAGPSPASPISASPRSSTLTPRSFTYAKMNTHASRVVSPSSLKNVKECAATGTATHQHQQQHHHHHQNRQQHHHDHQQHHHHQLGLTSVLKAIRLSSSFHMDVTSVSPGKVGFENRAWTPRHRQVVRQSRQWGSDVRSRHMR